VMKTCLRRKKSRQPNLIDGKLNAKIVDINPFQTPRLSENRNLWNISPCLYRNAKFHLRGVIRKIQDFVMQYNNFEISPKGINDILLRVGSACKKDYEDKIQIIRSAKWRYIDETGIKVNGENWWLWIFRTDTNETLVVIRKSRGSKVLEEILGLEHKGANIADGWRAYSWIDKLQRCWAHLLREVDHSIDTSGNGKKIV